MFQSKWTSYFINNKIMKKISLKNLNIQEVEQLTREQLKDVLGGFTAGTSGGTTGPEVTCPSDKPKCTVAGTTTCKSKYDCCIAAGYSETECKAWG
jgi:hypothetical protein